MRLNLKLLPLLLCLTLVLSACQATPQRRILQARQTYTATLNTLTAARALGRIDDATARDIEVHRRTVAQLLDAAENAGTADGQQSLLVQLNAALDYLIAQQAKVKP